jgi:hypothetical protein
MAMSLRHQELPMRATTVTPDLATLYKKYGPLLYSHFFRQLGAENPAMKATRYAFGELLRLNLRDEVDVVRWVRGLALPEETAQTESLW